MAGQTIHRNAEQFTGTPFEGIAQAMAGVRATPGPKQLANAWNHYTKFVFGTVNGKIESAFQTAMLGKAIRRSPLMSEHTFRLSQKAVEQASRGVLNTREQVQLGRQIDIMYGKYGKFSPTQRKAIAYYTPFIAWTLNATRFVYGTLPAGHPVATALITSAEMATDEWRKEQALDYFVKGALPGFLQGSIPTKSGGHLQLSRFTPFGIGTGNDILGNYASAVLPQISGALQIARFGQDWKGMDLRKPNGERYDPIDKVKAIGASIAESTIPFMSRYQAVAGKGYGQLNPFKEIPPGKNAKSGAGAKLDPATQKLIDTYSKAGPATDETQKLIDAYSKKKP
jgi:hypothetical protein